MNWAGTASSHVSDMLRAMVEAARGLVVHVQPSPLAAQPYRGETLDLFSRVVVGPVAGVTAATDGATRLAAAEGRLLAAATLTVLTPASAAAYVTVLSFKVPDSRKAVIRGVRVWTHDAMGLKALRWKLSVGKRQLLDDGDLAARGDPIPVQEICPPGTTIVLQAKNLDAYAATLVEAAIEGWVFPVHGEDDSLEGLVLSTQRRARIGREGCSL